MTVVLYALQTCHVKMAMKLCNKNWCLQFIITCAKDGRGLLHHAHRSPLLGPRPLAVDLLRPRRGQKNLGPFDHADCWPLNGR
jgi:hypothetical protein